MWPPGIYSGALHSNSISHPESPESTAKCQATGLEREARRKGPRAREREGGIRKRG